MQPVRYSIMTPSAGEVDTGELGLVADADGALLRIDFLRRRESVPHWIDSLAASGLDARRDDGALHTVATQLDEYFVGERQAFDLQPAPQGRGFEADVWSLLGEIAYGTTWSYGEVAARLKDPGAARAVGTAVGHNPIPIVIPCHRVIGADGSLVGYGGGLRLKEQLLVHEGALLCPLPRPRT